MSDTISQRFHPRDNSLNALRLLLASLVIVSHSWPLTGQDFEPHFGGANLGTWAVLGFFAISGFLITRSRLRVRRTRDFYRARALRILPAFVVALLVVAFVFAPLWPVQQFVTLITGPDFPIVLDLLIVFAVTVPLAFASCVLIERPFLARKAPAPAETPQEAPFP